VLAGSALNAEPSTSQTTAFARNVAPVCARGRALVRRIALLVVIFILGLSGNGLAAEPGEGTIKGSISNGTADGSNVTDIEITLKTYLDEKELEPATINTDAEGNFVFNGLSTEPEYGYELTLEYQEAEYFGERLSFDSEEAIKSTEIVVYDSTTNDEAVTVMMSHTIIYVEPENLRIIEYYLFVNESDKTYIGMESPSIAGVREALTFSLPREAIELSPGFGLMECCIYGSEDGFTDSMPVVPGGREVAYSYLLNNTSGKYTFSKNIDYNIKSYDILVQGTGITVSSNRLTAGEPLDIEGTPFTLHSGTDFAPGEIMVAQISGLPDTGSQGILLWVFLALGVLVGAFVFNRLLRGRRPQPAKVKESPEQIKQRLLVEIARLNDDFENGKISEEVYGNLRAEKKAKLIALM
jgi:hypothetical protein